MVSHFPSSRRRCCFVCVSCSHSKRASSGRRAVAATRGARRGSARFVSKCCFSVVVPYFRACASACSLFCPPAHKRVSLVVFKRECELWYMFSCLGHIKNNFFHFLFTFSRAHLRAFARAYNITFFLRARAHAREKVTRIAIIDRPLSMIVGGRVGALFFIVCFLSVLEIQIERFCISPPAWQIE